MRPLAIAHRAGNSLAGLRLANELGVDVIECDVRRGREQLEVRHLKSAGPLPFLWDRWELVPASAPRLGLHEVLAAQQHGTRFMLDLKGGRRSDLAGTLARLLHRAEVEGRTDDTEEVVRHRQEVYAAQTAPLISVYRDRGLLLDVDGMGSVEEVTQRICDGLEKLG